MDRENPTELSPGFWNSLPIQSPTVFFMKPPQTIAGMISTQKMVAVFIIILGEDVPSPFIMFPFMWRKVHKGSDLAFPSSLCSRVAEFRRRNRGY